MITASAPAPDTYALQIMQLEARIAQLEAKASRLDKEWILSPSTFKRALSVWGHTLLVQAIVTAVFLLVIMFVNV